MTIVERAVETTKTTIRTVLPRRLYGPIRARRVHRQVKRYSSRTVRHSYAGFPLEVVLEDPLADAWYDHDWEEPPELAVMRGGLLRPGARVFDIGAHQGVVALILSGIVGAEGQVVAVEAEPHNARVAQTNVAVNGVSNVTVLHAACAAHEGVVSFTESLNGVVARRRGAPGAVDVPAVTVDGLADRFGSPDVVLIDVEGYEAHVLDGAGRTLATGTTDVLVELHDAEALSRVGSSAEDVVEHFSDQRFRMQICRDTGETWQDLQPDTRLDGKRTFLYVQSRHAR